VSVFFSLSASASTQKAAAFLVSTRHFCELKQESCDETLKAIDAKTFRIINERLKQSSKQTKPLSNNNNKITKHKTPRFRNLSIIVGKMWRGINVVVIPTVVLCLHCFCD